MESAEQATTTLHKNVRPELEKMGEHTATIPPAETSFPLTEEFRQIGVDAKHLAGVPFKMVTGGATNIRETPSRNPLKIVKERVMGLLRRK